jgi:hypothetical protein
MLSELHRAAETSAAVQMIEGDIYPKDAWVVTIADAGEIALKSRKWASIRFRRIDIGWFCC